jgi:predicted dehydrogenase
MRHSIVKLLVVGLGSIGKRHIRILKELYPEVKIIILRHSQCNGDEVEKLGVYKCVTTIEEVLEFKPQAAIIANPATKHLEVAKALAEAGIQLLIEKPISATSQGVRELIELCHLKQAVLMTAYNFRFLPSLIEFRNLLQKQKVGKLYSIRAEVGQHLPFWRPESDYRETVSAQKSLGGGVLLELSHEIDYLSWIFGPIKWVKSHVSKQSELEIDVEDTAYMIFGFDNASGEKLTATLNMDFIRHDMTRNCIVIGEKGSLRWDGLTGEVLYFPEGGSEWEVIYSCKPERDYTYIEEIKHFIASIESGIPPLVTGENGLETVLAIEAIHKSSNSGTVVYL